MSIESELFANVEIQRDRLADYGFQPEGDLLIYRKPLPEDRFEIVLIWDGTIRGRIADLDTGDEYVNFRMENASGYSAGIRQKFTDLLTDIRDRCGRKLFFKTEQIGRSVSDRFPVILSCWFFPQSHIRSGYTGSWARRSVPCP